VAEPSASNQLEYYPDLGYVLVVLGNTDSEGTQMIATHVRDLIAGSVRRQLVSITDLPPISSYTDNESVGG
jgi:hypothetical protein